MMILKKEKVPLENNINKTRYNEIKNFNFKCFVHILISCQKNDSIKFQFSSGGARDVETTSECIISLEVSEITEQTPWQTLLCITFVAINRGARKLRNIALNTEITPFKYLEGVGRDKLTTFRHKSYVN